MGDRVFLVPDELPIDDELPVSPEPSMGFNLDAMDDVAPESLPVSPEAPSHGDEPSLAGDGDGSRPMEAGSSCGGSADSDVQDAVWLGASPSIAERSLRSRRGRKDPVLLEALAEAEAKVVALDTRKGALPLRPASSPGALASAPSGKDAVRGTQLPPEALANLVPMPFAGFALPSALERPLWLARELSRSGKEALDPEAMKIGEYFLMQAVAALSSKRIVSDTLGLDERKIDRVRIRLASAVLHADRAQRRALEDAIVRRVPADGCHLYVDFAAYDETPLPVQLRDGEFALRRAAKSHTSGDARMPQQDPRMANFIGGAPLRLTTSATSQKVLQHMQIGGMLLELGGRFVMLKVPTVGGLAVMERGTTAVLATCQQALSTATRAANAFKQQVRASCTDAGSSNLTCERMVTSSRGEKCTSLHTLCEVHRASLAHGKSLVLLDANIRGMIKCALSLRAGAALNTFRSCLAQEVASRLQILHGRPPPEAMAHKRAVLQLFVSHGRNLPVKRMLLALCPNGDWRSPWVQYYVPPLPTATEDKTVVLQHLVTGLVTALCASKPSVYPRHRWTGCDIATDELSIIEACHGLLTGTYKRFVACYQPGLARIFDRSAPVVTSAQLGCPALMDDTNDGGGDGLGPTTEDDEGVAVVGGEGEPAGGGAEDGASWALINAARRRDAARWLASAPFGHLVLQRLVMEPLRERMGALFREASAEWEREQECRAAAAMKEGRTDFGVRQYRLSIAACGRHDQRFKQQVHTLWSEPAMWQLLPDRCLNLSFRSLAFRSLSKLACSHKQLLAWPNERFPIRMFALLEQPDLAESMRAAPDCLLDAWSAQLRRDDPSLCGATFRLKLLLCAAMSWKDISSIEARHASIRRLLYTSPQTHSMSFADLASQWLLMQARTRATDFAAWQTRRGKKRLQRAAAKRLRDANRKKTSKACVCLCLTPFGRPCRSHTLITRVCSFCAQA